MYRHKPSNNNRFSRPEKLMQVHCQTQSWNIACRQQMSANLSDRRERQSSGIAAGLQQCILGLQRGRHEISFHLICSNIIALGLLSNIVLIGNSITPLQMIRWSVSVLERFSGCAKIRGTSGTSGQLHLLSACTEDSRFSLLLLQIPFKPVKCFCHDKWTGRALCCQLWI